MTRLAALIVGLLVGLAVTAAQAQVPTRVRGTITAVDGTSMTVRDRDGHAVKVVLTDKTAVAAVHAVKLADIKPGDGVGTTTRPGPGDALTALEVHVFPASMPVPNEGHRPWDLEPGSMMTNARVTAVVQSTNGRELTLTYKDGAQKIIVPEGTPIVSAQPADRAALKPGETVFFGGEKAADGTVTPTGRIQVSKDGVKPPM